MLYHVMCLIEEMYKIYELGIAFPTRLLYHVMYLIEEMYKIYELGIAFPTRLHAHPETRLKADSEDFDQHARCAC